LKKIISGCKELKKQPLKKDGSRRRYWVSPFRQIQPVFIPAQYELLRYIL